MASRGWRSVNRAQRRALPRKPPKLCATGTHAYQAWTVAGETKRVVCTGCGRTFEQVMEESPADLAIYRRWLAEELGKAVHNHEPDPKGPFIEGCTGCDREQALLAAEPSKLAIARLPVDGA